jgi:hypothetical protein
MAARTRLGLACFDSPSETAKQVEERFGIKVARQKVDYYNPTGVTAKTHRLADRWVQTFWAIRKKFLEETAAIGIANQSVRLRLMQRNYEKAEAKGNIGMCQAILEQAAKDKGGAFSNKQSLDLSGSVQVTEVRRQELIQRFSMRIEKAFENRAKEAGLLIEGPKEEGNT